MGLDITFLDDEGFPQEPFVLGMRDHDALMKAAEQLGLVYLCRFDDYFADIEIPLDAIGQLISELHVVEMSMQANPETRSAALSMRLIAEKALAAGRTLQAIAD